MMERTGAGTNFRRSRTTRNGVLFLLCLCAFLYNGFYVGQMCDDVWTSGAASRTEVTGRRRSALAGLDQRRVSGVTDSASKPAPSFLGLQFAAEGGGSVTGGRRMALPSSSGSRIVRASGGQPAVSSSRTISDHVKRSRSISNTFGIVTSSANGNPRDENQKGTRNVPAKRKRQRHLHRKLLKKANIQKLIQDGRQKVDFSKSRLQLLIGEDRKTFGKPEKMLGGGGNFSKLVNSNKINRKQYINRFYKLFSDKSSDPLHPNRMTRVDGDHLRSIRPWKTKVGSVGSDRRQSSTGHTQSRIDSDQNLTLKPNRRKNDSTSNDVKLFNRETLDYDDDVVYIKGNVTARRRLPRALIVGVKKGGTRALLEFIRLHPQVKAVGPETHFFDRYYDKGLAWYRQQMPPTSDVQLTMEKTPSYFVTREVPKRIRGMARDIKLLVVLRDPVTRAISDYAQTVSKRPHMKSFDELAFLNNSTGLVDTSWGAIKIGVYARHLEHWLQFFPLEQFHFVSGERLIKDPASEMAKVQDFLGIKRYITDNHFYFNETKGFPCLRKAEGSPRCLGKTKGRTHPVVDNSTIANLRDFFRPFNMKFYQMTGVDFGWP